MPTWTGQSGTLWNAPPAEIATRSATISNAYELASGVRSARNERHKRGEDLIVAALLGNPTEAAQQAAPRSVLRTARSTSRAPVRMPASTPPNASTGGVASFLAGSSSSGPSNSPSTSNAASTSNSAIRTIGQAFKQRLFGKRKNADLLGSVEASLRDELERDMVDASEAATGGAGASTGMLTSSDASTTLLPNGRLPCSKDLLFAMRLQAAGVHPDSATRPLLASAALGTSGALTSQGTTSTTGALVASGLVGVAGACVSDQYEGLANDVREYLLLQTRIAGRITTSDIMREFAPRMDSLSAHISQEASARECRPSASRSGAATANLIDRNLLKALLKQFCSFRLVDLVGIWTLKPEFL